MSTFIDYKQYMKDQSPLLREKFITENDHAESWISGPAAKGFLLVHHESYTNLYHEKLNKDVFLVTVPEHKQIHFLFGVIKLPLIPFLLKKRREWLRVVYNLKHKRFTEAFYSLSLLVFV